MKMRVRILLCYLFVVQSFVINAQVSECVADIKVAELSRDAVANGYSIKYRVDATANSQSAVVQFKLVRQYLSGKKPINEEEPWSLLISTGKGADEGEFVEAFDPKKISWSVREVSCRNRNDTADNSTSKGRPTEAEYDRRIIGTWSCEAKASMFAVKNGVRQQNSTILVNSISKTKKVAFNQYESTSEGTMTTKLAAGRNWGDTGTIEPRTLAIAWYSQTSVMDDGRLQIVSPRDSTTVDGKKVSTEPETLIANLEDNTIVTSKEWELVGNDGARALAQSTSRCVKK